MATLSAKELAQELGTDGRTVRKYLRATVRAAGIANPGKGQRWSIDRKDVRKIRKDFAVWEAARVAAETTESDETPETA
jgi:predicted transcriptional regulator